ncbi:MAG: hypothetical protein GY838_15880 [bacterium]|nr:hypothetical protein [bacterium]
MARRDGIHGIILVVLGLAVTGLVLWAVATGWDFYVTSPEERPHHEDFRVYRPAGDVGHGLGILGTAMVLLLLLYTARKRVRAMRRWGNLRVWLRYHIFLGVAGPIFITLHTSFRVGGLVAASYWSMVAAALSGVVGRYLYQQIPRNVLGETLSSDEVEAACESLLVELTTDHGVSQEALDGLEILAVGSLENRPAPVALLALPYRNIMLARQLQSWMVGFSGGSAGEMRVPARKWVLLTRRLLLFHQIRDLFHYWHVFHKPFAFIMILVMIVHVAVAVALGYTWRVGS